MKKRKNFWIYWGNTSIQVTVIGIDSEKILRNSKPIILTPLNLKYAFENQGELV